MSEYESVRREACRWVRDACAVARSHFGRTTASAKADASPVTEADHAVQDALQDTIARTFPGDAVVTEETQQRPGRHARLAAATRCWVIDPIDGTRNYARSIPVFSISLALLEEGRPVVGVVADPISEHVWSASKGAGLWRDHVRYAPSPTAPSATGWLIAAPSGQRKGLPASVHRWMDTYNVRNLGSTALHLVYLASGGFDAVFVSECHLWDIAGAWVMTEEMGMDVRSLDGMGTDVRSPGERDERSLGERDERLHGGMGRDERSLGGTLPFPMDLASEAGREITFLAARPEVMDRLWPELIGDFPE